MPVVKVTDLPVVHRYRNDILPIYEQNFVRNTIRTDTSPYFLNRQLQYLCFDTICDDVVP